MGDSLFDIFGDHLMRQGLKNVGRQPLSNNGKIEYHWFTTTVETVVIIIAFICLLSYRKHGQSGVERSAQTQRANEEG